MIKIKEQMITAIKVLWQKGLLAAGDGNFSFKHEGSIWITPSGCRKCDLKPEDFVNIFKKKEGFQENLLTRPSSETSMHLEVYNSSPLARVVFHAHPPTAVAYSISNDEGFLPENLISELILSAGRTPIVPYARPGSKDMGDNLKPFLPESRILILKHHGALSWGESVEEALNGMERVEHTCEIFWKAKSMQTSREELLALPEGELEWLQEKRKSLGEKVL